MATATINHISGAEAESSAITVGASEKVAVRLSRYDEGCKALLKINLNSVVTYKPIYLDNTIYDAMAEGAELSVVTNLRADGNQWVGGVEGIIESYS